MIYYIADTHFGHENILHYDSRPFKNIETMDDALVFNWNNSVRPEDTVYVLGDAFWGNEERCVQIMKMLNGHKHLIQGNHDKVQGKLKNLWESISQYAEITDKETPVVLSHYPIMFYKNQRYGAVMLYGHVHKRHWGYIEKWRNEQIGLGLPSRLFNVGCMMDYMNYTPRTLNEILEANEI